MRNILKKIKEKLGLKKTDEGMEIKTSDDTCIVFEGGKDEVDSELTPCEKEGPAGKGSVGFKIKF